jgi:predicted ATPase/class 3 adenylate cyclase
MQPPSGTVALLFTDIEGSTRLAHSLGDGWGMVLAIHHQIVGGAIEAHGGYVDGTEGDAFFAVFDDAREAARAAVDAQRALRRHAWPPEVGILRVRMGLHVGHVERQDSGYVGLEIHRAARVASAAHGGQLLLTEAARALVDVPTEELGRHRLKDFPAAELLHCAVIDGRGAAAFPPPHTLVVRPTNLPPDDRLLIGREDDLRAITDAIVEDGERLVTLTGMGGSGKTRLALAAGAALLDAHPGGVWWVPLAAAPGERGVLPGLVAALGAEDDGSRPLLQLIAGRIADRPTLAVLDNLEHLGEAAAEVAELLAGSPALRVLATSQTPLRLTTERLMPVDPLRREASRELFTALAARVRSDIRFDADDLQVVDDLCDGLDHLPLAIELAAARLVVLSLHQLSDRLAESLTLLKSGERDRPARQRSLQATVEWTLSLLDPPARTLFTRLGAFAAAVELDDLEAVCAQEDLDVLGAVAALMEVGILRRLEGEDGLIRFRLPEALRQVAAAELDTSADGPEVRRAHAEHVADTTWPAASAKVATVTAYRRAAALDAEAVLALTWAWREDPSTACRIAAARAARLSDGGRLREADALANQVLDCADAEDTSRAAALAALGHSAVVSERREIGVQHLRAAGGLAPLGSDLRIYTGHVLIFAVSVGAPNAAWREEADAWVSEARTLGSPHALAVILVQRAQAAISNRDLDVAVADLAEAERLAQKADAQTMWYLDTIRGDLELAERRPDAAAQSYLRSLTSAASRGDALQMFFDLHGIAAALALGDCPEEALEAFGLGMAQGEDVGRSGKPPADTDLVKPLEDARAALGADAAEAIALRGAAIPEHRRVQQARALVEKAGASTAEPHRPSSAASGRL